MKVFRITAAAAVLCLLPACGEAKFSNQTGQIPPVQAPTPRPDTADVVRNGGDQPGDEPTVETPVPTPPTDPTVVITPPSPTPIIDPGTVDPTVAKAKSLTWYWQCLSSPGTAPVPASADDLVVVGSSTQTYLASRLAGVPMTVAGEICPFDTKRDIIFVIDVSGSMQPNPILNPSGGNDPRLNNNCGRLAAVNAVVASAAQGSNARFAGLTFSDTIYDNSGGFVTNVNSMFSGNLADVICNTTSGTDYTEALLGAEALLANARADASHEIYFITDGQPDSGQAGGINDPAINGVAVAERLRAAGVTISTIMLGSDSVGDTLLRTKIASTTPAGDMLHANAANASQLAAMATALAQNDLSVGQVMYRPVGASAWTSFDMTKQRSANRFSLPVFSIDPSVAPMGLELQYNYQDRRGKTYSGSGNLLWVTKAP